MLKATSDFTQAQAAKIIGASQQHYGKYESGMIVIPFDRVIVLADYHIAKI
ncbi:MAG: helix-turn-helix transcriptional regulator [Ruminococcaceae bacterium]|nr:helix-turn-helix transcriptional regulator [Oscillospiraceae bacterium]